MNLESFRLYCLSKQGATEDMPFDETTLVFRIASRIFTITDVERIPFRANLKCDPERAIDLRERFDCITPGYHMNKKHWNSIEPEGNLEDDFFKELIDHSYDLIYNKLKKVDKQKILNLEAP